MSYTFGLRRLSGRHPDHLPDQLPICSAQVWTGIWLLCETSIIQSVEKQPATQTLGENKILHLLGKMLQQWN